ncbi:MAG: hypothetical protein Q4Q06_06280 [Bacteroidota bacterium]|nr:hypothetical protein [Bacteroidota bacterium]
MKKLFIGGDLSGIQNFLYNISSKKAALSLRGRSAYLSDYMQEVYKELVNKLKKEQEIYNDGGKFYCIVEDTEQNRKIVDAFAIEKSKQIWEKHFGELAINIAYVPYESEKDNDDKETIKNCFGDISEKFRIQKQQKFKDLLIKNYETFFEPQKIPADIQVCDVTGIESKELEQIKVGDDTLKVLPSVKEQINKGIKLKKEDKDYKDFADYTKGSYLGVLRMDVDSLSKRFQSGFNNWCEYKTFSNKLTGFFKRENLKNFFDKDFVELIYAGGDDVFAVGKWDKIIDFAYNLHKALDKQFKEEKIHISGGVAIVDDKFPISKSAELSGKAEEKAKSSRAEKNAFTLFNETVSWEQEFETVKQYKEEMWKLVNDYDMPKSILHQIMYYYELYKEGEKDTQGEKDNKEKNGNKFKYLWHSAYYLTRFMENKDEEIKYFCVKVRDKRIRDPKVLRLLAIAARWTELLKKDEERKEQEK